MNTNPLLLCILDGVGLNPNTEANAVHAANTPTLDKLFSEYPNTTLTTFGERVGLPKGQMGNSEVGHLNIGAGRVVKQWLVRIADAFATGDVETAQPLKNFLEKKTAIGKVHLIGLFSFGGVHSDAEHLFALTEVLIKHNPDLEIVYHLIADGRDTAPRQIAQDLPRLVEIFKRHPKNLSLGSLHGRYYAMDRDKRWERVQKSYEAFTAAGETLSLNALKTHILKSYENGITDEFIPPISCGDQIIREADSLLFWNFRSDRMRQLLTVFSTEDFDGFTRSLPVFERERILCFTEYDRTLNLPVLFPPETISNHFGATLSANNISQLRVAETEKYPHVTYFMNGGIEKPETGEERAMVPSPQNVKTYDEKPEMSAYQARDTVLNALKTGSHQVIVVNFANGDMVGHTGDLAAATKAVEVVDECLGEILETLKKKNGEAVIIADHGNAEQMIDYNTGEPHTAHTTHPVPAILFSERHRGITLNTDPALCDVAPTLLKLLAIDQPDEMTGKALF